MNQVLNGHKSEQTPRDREGQRSLACCSPWGHDSATDSAVVQLSLTTIPMEKWTISVPPASVTLMTTAACRVLGVTRVTPVPVSNFRSLPRTQHDMTVQGKVFTGPIQSKQSLKLGSWCSLLFKAKQNYTWTRVERPLFKQILSKKWGRASPAEQIFIFENHSF